MKSIHKNNNNKTRRMKTNTLYSVEVMLVITTMHNCQVDLKCSITFSLYPALTVMFYIFASVLYFFTDSKQSQKN